MITNASIWYEGLQPMPFEAWLPLFVVAGCVILLILYLMLRRPLV